MVSRDRSLVEPLLEELLTSKVVYVGPIRQQLRPYAGELKEKLRAILRDRKPTPFAASAPQWRWWITFPNPRRPRGPSRT